MKLGKLEDLIAQVEDVALRQSLVTAASEAKEARNFGLVFEQHIPETVAVLGLPLRRGQRVRLRSQIDAGPDFTVVKATKKTVTLEANDGSSFDVTPGEVAVVKRFGEPIYPTLTPIGEVRRSDGRAHTVINGENYHALQTFLYLYEGQVDCIYIDPPYNTGARDWKYNNRYVDDQDSWRHSKWLSFIEKRLLLAKRLLRDDGVVIITIDEHEVHHLGMLLEQLFPDSLRSMVTIVNNPKGTGATNFARVEEYAFFICPSGTEVIERMPFAFAMPTEVAPRDHRVIQAPDGEGAGLVRRLALRRDGAESSNRADRPRQFYALLIDPETLDVRGIGPELSPTDDPPEVPVDGLVPVYPVDGRGRQRVWRYGRETMTQRIADGEIRVTRFDRRRATYSLYHFKPVDREEAERRRPRTVWWNSSHDAGAHGSTLLNSMLGARSLFPFPKSVYAVADCLRVVTETRPKAVVLDFFAGSGTTLHSTCLLNAQDGGSRRSIIITNNEVSERDAAQLAKAGLHPGDPEFEARGIFELVTRPRCTAAVTGQGSDGERLPGRYLDGRDMSEGFEEAVEFYKLEYLDPDSVRLGDQLDAILPMLRLAAGAVGSIPPVGADPWLIPNDGSWAILLDDSRFAKFRADIEKRSDLTHVWLVTTSEEAFARMRVQLPPNLRVSMLYRDYLRNFEINTEQP